MYHVAFTPNTSPANAIYSKGESILEAIAILLSDLQDVLEPTSEWLASALLEAIKQAVDNLENDLPATGSWTDMGCEDDAFRIDIFCADDLKFIRYDDSLYCVPHGAIGLAIGKFHHLEWIYAETDLPEWDEVLMPIEKRWEEVEGKSSEAIVDYENNADEFWIEFQHRVAKLDRKSELAHNCMQLLLLDRVEFSDESARVAFEEFVSDIPGFAIGPDHAKRAIIFHQ